MKRCLSIAALGAALIMSGCVVPVDRYNDQGGRGSYGNGDRRDDCRDRANCDRRDRDGDHRDEHGRPLS